MWCLCFLVGLASFALAAKVPSVVEVCAADFDADYEEEYTACLKPAIDDLLRQWDIQRETLFGAAMKKIGGKALLQVQLNVDGKCYVVHVTAAAPLEIHSSCVRDGECSTTDNKLIKCDHMPRDVPACAGPIDTGYGDKVPYACDGTHVNYLLARWNIPPAFLHGSAVRTLDGKTMTQLQISNPRTGKCLVAHVYQPSQRGGPMLEEVCSHDGRCSTEHSNFSKCF